MDVFVGIDVSLNSTGVSFISSDGKTRYLSILNRWIFTSSPKKSFNDVVGDSMLLTGIAEVDNFDLVLIDRKPLTDIKKIGLSPWARLHTRNCMIYSDLIVEKIEQVLTDYFSGCNVVMGIENYSLGSFSKGTNSVQIIEITSLLKAKFFNIDMSRLDNYQLLAGPSIKMFASKGNADKFMMLKAYLGSNKYKDGLFSFIAANEVLCYTKKTKNKKKHLPANKKLGTEKRTIAVTEVFHEVHSPISDIVDAWWIAENTKYIASKHKN